MLGYSAHQISWYPVMTLEFHDPFPTFAKNTEAA